MYLCPHLDCGFWSTSVTVFHDHQMSSHNEGERNFKCSVCSQSFFTRAAISNHIHNARATVSPKFQQRREAHRTATTLRSTPIPRHRYKAQMCSLAVNGTQGRIVHQNAHRQTAPTEPAVLMAESSGNNAAHYNQFISFLSSFFLSLF